MNINILWLKKDIRLIDHLPLEVASKQSFVAVYIFEPSVSCNYDFDIRHWRFIYQSLVNLKDNGLDVQLMYGEALPIFEYLVRKFGKITVYSHQESGNDLTFNRDLAVKKYFKNQNIPWHEFQTNMVIRGLKNRDTWDAKWIKHAKHPILKVPSLSKQISLDDHNFSIPKQLLEKLSSPQGHFQVGGESIAHKILEEFLSEKIEEYWGSISYPEKSRYYCSLLSPFITYGNLSIRQIYQKCDEFRPHVINKKSLDQFQIRLKWHCHFIQKLEMEPRIEFENLNPIFNSIRNKRDKKIIKAWMYGQTGFPLIDAAMRCVQETGYLNFRLRATVVSFATHILWQPWQSISGYLARMFLDYEPGIHFSQLQMQAGTTGINTIRIYNPIKQSKEKDKEGIFIKRWVPELRALPTNFVHCPWEMTQMDEMMYSFKLGEDYPLPIVNFNEAYKHAQEKLWQIKNTKQNKMVIQKILRKHTSKKGKKHRKSRKSLI